MNNSRSNVYRGDFRKSVKACEFTHVGVFMRTRRADSHFAASRVLCRFQAGNAGTSDLVGTPAMRDLGSLQCISVESFSFFDNYGSSVDTYNSNLCSSKNSRQNVY